MKFKDYMLTLDGHACIVWLRQLSVPLSEGENSFALIGVLEAHEDFLIIHSDHTGAPTAVQHIDVICIEPCGAEDDDEEEMEADIEADIYESFERNYKRYKEEL